MANPKIVISGDSPSLWNCTLSPGWSREEVKILRLAIIKFGVGKWKEIIESGCLPGKNPSQLSLQCQRLLGQQSIGEFMGIHLDTEIVFQRNEKKEGIRKNGCLINSGKNQTPEERQEKTRKNIARFQLSQEVIDGVELPRRDEEQNSSQKEKIKYLRILYARRKALQDEYKRRFSSNYECTGYVSGVKEGRIMNLQEGHINFLQPQNGKIIHFENGDENKGLHCLLSDDGNKLLIKGIGKSHWKKTKKRKAHRKHFDEEEEALDWEENTIHSDSNGFSKTFSFRKRKKVRYCEDSEPEEEPDDFIPKQEM